MPTDSSVNTENMTFAIEENADAADIKTVNDGLRTFNRQHTPAPNPVPLNIFLRDAEHKVCGGLLAETRWNWLLIEILWIDDAHRNADWGTRLIETVHTEAAKRGCKHALLDTTSYQARGFYEKQGYTVVGTVEGYPPDSTVFYMRREL